MAPKIISEFGKPAIVIFLIVYAYVNIKEWLPIAVELFKYGATLIGGILV